MALSIKQIRYFITAADTGQVSLAAIDIERLAVGRHRLDQAA